ncbi:hypothetical protein AB0D67_37660 [Streptosporangium sp. NPDC048047]|uniref:hypothetical protein n=1 Tax=Streptosporangium sp. NPDC048047 TaxID=3155748 RepID=UPI003419A61C
MSVLVFVLPELQEYEERAAAGATVMDEHAINWHWVVEPTVVDMEHGSHCVIGQYLGDWEIHHFELGLDDDELLSHGFYLVDGTEAQYAALNQAWRTEINTRRERDRTTKIWTRHLGELLVGDLLEGAKHPMPSEITRGFSDAAGRWGVRELHRLIRAAEGYTASGGPKGEA